MGTGRDFLANFRLVRLIRAGATCQVWESRDIDNRRVALKALQPEVRGNKDEIAYIRHEYEVGKQLKHPNVIEIYDCVNERGNVPFLVMEFHNGKNVKLLLRDGVDYVAPMATRIITTSAQGLAYFHEQGWVHRDIKPDNFLVDEVGESKLIDFALAQKRASGLSKLFGKSKIQGTRSYMSPEQIRGKPLDERADIYSFGCMMYEVLTGKLPYTGSNPEELLNKHLRAGIPTPISVNRNLTPECNALIMQLMAKNADDRPSNMNDILRAMKGMRLFRQTPVAPKKEDNAVPEP